MEKEMKREAERELFMLVLVRRLSVPIMPDRQIALTLALDADQRTRSRHQFVSIEGETVNLQLPRGTLLRDGDLLSSEDGEAIARVVATPEPVITVTAQCPLDLLRAAYHLGNRHVPMEVTEFYLRLSPDSVLQDMLSQLGLDLTPGYLPFQPEAGAYGGHSHHPH
jgi:urease accessory protein